MIFRFFLTAIVLVVAAWLIVAHGVRGIAIVAAGIIVFTLPRTRGWKVIEGALVRVTGSRRRAAVLAFGIILVAMAAFDVYQLFHG